MTKKSNKFSKKIHLFFQYALDNFAEAYIFSNKIPRTKQVQQGYIVPSEIEIKCKDLDGNGEPETIIKIGDKSYLLIEVDGKPIISPYEIKPAEVIPKEEEQKAK